MQQHVSQTPRQQQQQEQQQPQQLPMPPVTTTTTQNNNPPSGTVHVAMPSPQKDQLRQLLRALDVGGGVGGDVDHTPPPQSTRSWSHPHHRKGDSGDVAFVAGPKSPLDSRSLPEVDETRRSNKQKNLFDLDLVKRRSKPAKTVGLAETRSRQRWMRGVFNVLFFPAHLDWWQKRVPKSRKWLLPACLLYLIHAVVLFVEMFRPPTLVDFTFEAVLPLLLLIALAVITGQAAASSTAQDETKNTASPTKSISSDDHATRISKAGRLPDQPTFDFKESTSNDAVATMVAARMSPRRGNGNGAKIDNETTETPAAVANNDMPNVTKLGGTTPLPARKSRRHNTGGSESNSGNRQQKNPILSDMSFNSHDSMRSDGGTSLPLNDNNNNNNAKAPFSSIATDFDSDEEDDRSQSSSSSNESSGDEHVENVVAAGSLTGLATTTRGERAGSDLKRLGFARGNSVMATVRRSSTLGIVARGSSFDAELPARRAHSPTPGSVSATSGMYRTSSIATTSSTSPRAAQSKGAGDVVPIPPAPPPSVTPPIGGDVVTRSPRVDDDTNVDAATVSSQQQQQQQQRGRKKSMRFPWTRKERTKSTSGGRTNNNAGNNVAGVPAAEGTTDDRPPSPSKSQEDVVFVQTQSTQMVSNVQQPSNEVIDRDQASSDGGGGGGGGGGTGGGGDFEHRGHSQSVEELDAVKSVHWTGEGAPEKLMMTVNDLRNELENKVDQARPNTVYFFFADMASVIASLLPVLFRISQSYGDVWMKLSCMDMVKFTVCDEHLTRTSLRELVLVFWAHVFGNTYWDYFVLTSSIASTLILARILLRTVAGAVDTYRRRLLYAKLFSKLTSNRKARKADLPHFRLHKVENIKVWLSLRSKRLDTDKYLLGPYPCSDSTANALVMSGIFLVGAVAFKALQRAGAVEGGKKAAKAAGTEYDNPLQPASLEDMTLFFWALILSVYVQRIMSLVSSTQEKYQDTSILLTEELNIHTRMLRKPHKKDELSACNAMLKVAGSLIKELEGGKSKKGQLGFLVIDPALYSVIRVILLSALGALSSDLFGFRVRLWKI